jgi:hypothetical protein
MRRSGSVPDRRVQHALADVAFDDARAPLIGCRRPGASPMIIEALKAEALSAGASLDIGVEKDNPRARRLYERLGCVQVAEDEEEYKLRWRP